MVQTIRVCSSNATYVCVCVWCLPYAYVRYIFPPSTAFSFAFCARDCCGDVTVHVDNKECKKWHIAFTHFFLFSTANGFSPFSRWMRRENVDDKMIKHGKMKEKKIIHVIIILLAQIALVKQSMRDIVVFFCLFAFDEYRVTCFCWIVCGIVLQKVCVLLFNCSTKTKETRVYPEREKR